MRPDCCTEHLREVLFFTADLLERHAIPYWLDHGSLLGAVREGRFIAWDNDADLGIYLENVGQVLALTREIQDAGYAVHTTHFSIQIQYSKQNSMHVDLFPWWERDGLMHYRFLNGQVNRFPNVYLEHLNPIKLEGREFPAPSPVHSFLSDHRYGPNFMTPMNQNAWQGFFDARYRVPPLPDTLTEERFAANLCLLYDCLEQTTFAGRFWVWRHLLLAWFLAESARPNGRNAHFGYMDKDHSWFLAATRRCFAQGFEPYSVFSNSQGKPVHYVFVKDDRFFHFYRFAQGEGSNGPIARYWLHTSVPQVRRGSVEWEGQLPLSGWTTYKALGRIWKVPAPPEGWLTAIYGDWQSRTQLSHQFPQDHSIVHRRFWQGEGSPELKLPPGVTDFHPWA